MNRDPSAYDLKDILAKLQSINDRCNRTISQHSAHSENLDKSADAHSNLLRATLNNTSALISFELDSLESKLTTISKKFLTFEQSILNKTSQLSSTQENFFSLEKTQKKLSKDYSQ
jgi:hypothetical protein